MREFLHDPVTHSVDRASEPVPDMTHHVFTVRKDDRTAVVQELAAGRGRTMFFTRTKHSAAGSPASSRRRASPPPSCTATSARARGTATSGPSATARSASWSPPTSPRAASTSTTSPSSCTSTRRRSTRPTCTARGAPRAPARPGTSSRSWRPTSATTSRRCPQGRHPAPQRRGRPGRARDRRARRRGGAAGARRGAARAPEGRSQSRPESRPAPDGLRLRPSASSRRAGRPRWRRRRRWRRWPQRWWSAGDPRRAVRAGGGGQPSPSIPLRHPPEQVSNRAPRRRHSGEDTHPAGGPMTPQALDHTFSAVVARSSATGGWTSVVMPGSPSTALGPP